MITRMIVGGAQENTLLTIRGLLERGHHVVLVTGPTRGPEGKLLEQESIPGLEVVQVPALQRAMNPWKDFLAYRHLRRFMKRNDFDVVHTHSSKAGILGRLAAHAAQVPVIVHTVHGQPFHAYETRWRNWLYIKCERFAARVSTRIFAVAQAMIEQCVQARIAPRHKYRLVYSGMRLEPFLSASADNTLREHLGIPPEAVVVGKIARLFDLKGHDYLIRAAPEIVRACPQAHFLLVGDGTRREELSCWIRRLGLEEHFTFAGLVSPEDIPRYTALMDMLVHFSLREGLPRTVVQALASGVPAVGFNLDGTPEIIRDGETGFLIEPEDVGGIRDAVLALLHDPQRRQCMGRAGRDLVQKRFDWCVMVQEIEKMYYSAFKAERDSPPDPPEGGAATQNG